LLVFVDTFLFLRPIVGANDALKNFGRGGIGAMGMPITASLCRERRLVRFTIPSGSLVCRGIVLRFLWRLNIFFFGLGRLFAFAA
jgi:hypothetical protein